MSESPNESLSSALSGESSEPTSAGSHIRRLINQFAMYWTIDGPPAEEYWRSYPEFDGNLETLCGLLSHEYRLRLRGIAADDLETRRKLFEIILARLQLITEDEAVWNCLQTEIDQQIEFDEDDDGAISPPNVGVSVSSLDSYQIKGRVEGANAGEQAQLGKGGFKAVLLANQQNLSRDVVLKFPIDGLSVYHVGVEARILKRLSHQNIPPVHEYRNSHPKYGCYIVETFAGRETWGQVIRRERDRILAIEDLMKRRSEWERTLEQHVRILHSVCQPVRYAHEVHGLAHVDLKPGNVMLRQPKGRVLAKDVPYDFSTAEVFVIDWGEGVFVREVEDPEGLEGRLIRNKPMVSGTPGYRPPELESMPGVKVDYDKIKNWFAIDVYTLGAILFQLFTGRPIQSVTRKGKELAKEECPQELKETGWTPPPELLAIQQKAMSASPEQRYQSVAEFMTAIERYLRNAIAAREIELAVNDRHKWAERVGQRKDTTDKSRAVARETMRSFVDEGNAISQRFQLASHQILEQPWAPSTVVPPDQPALKTALTQLQEIWQINLVLTREMGEYQQAHSMLDKLASLPMCAMDSVNQSRREIEALNRRREQKLLAIWVLVPAVALLAMTTIGGVARSLRAETAKQKAETVKEQAVVQKKELQIQNILLESERKLADERSKAEEAKRKVAEANHWKVILSQPFELSGQRAAEGHAKNVSARLISEVVNIRGDDMQSQVLLREALADALLPINAVRAFDDRLPEERLEGKGFMEQRFQFALTINTLSQRSGMLVCAGPTKSSRLRAWNLDTLRPMESFNKTAWEIPLEDNSLIGGLALSPDDKRLAIGLQSGEIRILDVVTGKVLQKTQGHQTDPDFKNKMKNNLKDLPFFEIGRLAWSPDGKWIATHTGLGDSIRIWDANSLTMLFEFPLLDVLKGEAYSPPEFCGNGHFLAAVKNRSHGKNKQTLVVMDMPGSEQKKRKPGDIKEFFTLVSKVFSLASASDGKLLSVGGTNAIEIWDTSKDVSEWVLVSSISTAIPNAEWMKIKSDGLPLAVRLQLAMNDDLTIAMSFSPDRRLLAVTRGDGTLSVLNVASGQVLWNGMGLPPTLTYDANSFPRFTTTGELFTIGTDGRLLAWELGAKRVFPTEELDEVPYSRSVIGSDGRYFKDVRGKAITWYEADDPRHPLKSKDRGDGRLLHRPQTEFPEDVTNVLAAPQKNCAVAAFAKGGIAVVDLKSGKHRSFGTGTTLLGFRLASPTIRNEQALAVSADGFHAAANHADGGIIVVEIGGGRIGHNDDDIVVTELDFTRLKSKLGKANVVSLAFHPSRSNELVATTTRGGVEVWSLDQADKPARIIVRDQLPSMVTDAPDAGRVCYTPDGKQLVVAQGPTMRLFDADSAALLQEWKGHDPVLFAGARVVSMNALAFRDDGLRLVSLASDGKVRLWDRTSLKGEFYAAGAISLTDLRSFQIGAELAESDEEDITRETHLISDFVSLQFLDHNRVFVDTNYCTARIYDLSRLDEFYSKSAQELIAFTEGMTGLTIRDPNIKVINGRAESKDIRVEFSPEVHRPQPPESFEPRFDKAEYVKAITLSDKLDNEKKPADAEAVITEFITRNPQVLNHPEGPHLLRRRALSKWKQKKFAEALEDCDRVLNGFEGWPLNPADDLPDDARLPDGKPVPLTLAHVLYYRATSLVGLKGRDAEALKAALSSAAWARKTLADSKSHLYGDEDRDDLMYLLKKSTETAERLFINQGKPSGAALVRSKANVFLKK